MADYTHFDAGTFAKWIFTKIKGLLSGYVKTSDSRLSDARKASDVSAWAKASSKPSYSWGEITGKPSTFPPSAHTHSMSQITDLGVFGGASATAAGSTGLVPQPAAGDQDKYLSAKGTWESITGKISGTKVTSANSADKLTTSRTLTIGNTGKSFDGSANVSWSLSEIGALPVGYSPEFLSATDKSVNVATVPCYSFIQLNQEFGTGDSTDTETYFKNWVKKMVKSHSNLSGINIIATAHPNTQGTIIFRAYFCTDYNGTGMPEHCKGIWIGLGDHNTYEFGTSYGVWHFDRSIMENEVSIDRTAYSVVRRDRYGYVNASYFNQSSPEEVPNSSSYVIYCNSDGSFRKSSFENIKKFVGGSQSVKYTLSASGWSGSSAPYTYDLGPTYGANAIIGFDSAVGNTTQLEAARAADIQGSSTTKIYAYGDKPTVDIPIIIQYS